jgi:hypothetical protein
MKPKEGHCKFNLINRELLSDYTLMEAFFITPKLYEDVDSNSFWMQQMCTSTICDDPVFSIKLDCFSHRFPFLELHDRHISAAFPKLDFPPSA